MQHDELQPSPFLAKFGIDKLTCRCRSALRAHRELPGAALSAGLPSGGVWAASLHGCGGGHHPLGPRVAHRRHRDSRLRPRLQCAPSSLRNLKCARLPSIIALFLPFRPQQPPCGRMRASMQVAVLTLAWRLCCCTFCHPPAGRCLCRRQTLRRDGLLTEWVSYFAPLSRSARPQACLACPFFANTRHAGAEIGQLRSHQVQASLGTGRQWEGNFQGTLPSAPQVCERWQCAAGAGHPDGQPGPFVPPRAAGAGGDGHLRGLGCHRALPHRVPHGHVRGLQPLLRQQGAVCPSRPLPRFHAQTV